MVSLSRCGHYIGIDNDKVKRLKEIVDGTGAKIVLCSSWKSCWERTNKDEQDSLANYLDKKLRKENLFILDKTIDKEINRGEGVVKWLSKHNVDSWTVLDDEVFDDYESFRIMEHLVKTSFYDDRGGLQADHVIKAIEILNRKC